MAPGAPSQQSDLPPGTLQPGLTLSDPGTGLYGNLEATSAEAFFTLESDFDCNTWLEPWNSGTLNSLPDRNFLSRLEPRLDAFQPEDKNKTSLQGAHNFFALWIPLFHPMICSFVCSPRVMEVKIGLFVEEIRFPFGFMFHLWMDGGARPASLVYSSETGTSV